MHPAYPTPHQEEYTHTSHLIKTFINKSISEQGIRGQFVPNSTQRRHRSTASHKYLISCLCISITTWAITTLKQPRPLLDRGNSHKHFYKRPKGSSPSLHTMSPGSASWAPLPSQNVTNILTASLYVPSYWNHSRQEMGSLSFFTVFLLLRSYPLLGSHF